jgi:hypothetical protein
MMKTAKEKFHLIYFIIFFSVVAVVAFYIIKMVAKTKTEILPGQFRAAITSIKFQHGSSFSAFIKLSNGDECFLTMPQTGITLGDSIIKIKNEPFYRVIKASGQEVGKSSLYGTAYRE